MDFEKPHKAAEIVQKIGAKHGVEMPTKPDTIANKMKQAQDYLKSQ